jgi:LCP family protein required for cell wall assembly
MVAAAVLYLQHGKEIVGNSTAAVGLAQMSGKVPEWALFAAPAAAAFVIVLTTIYLAFGRHLPLKVVGMATVVLVLAAPGMALGWANGTVGTVGNRSEEVQGVVSETQRQLRPPLPGQAMNILLIGRDQAGEDDPGRSDTQILVRLDPRTKAISMLSLPRDLRVEIPGHGLDKINTAYTYGGSALAVQTFTAVTGLPVNHFIEVDFAGFWHSVNILGGVYIPVDRRYYNPPGTGYKSINIAPGYQLLRGRHALDYVRFRHDENGDFGRMQRQQLFLKETQRQSSRWSEDWTKVAKLIQAVTAETTSDIDSLKRLKPLVELVFQVDTSKVYTTHLEGATPTIDGISYVTSTQQEIAEAVARFTNPIKPPVQSVQQKVSKKMYGISVYNASGIPDLALPSVQQLSGLGYKVSSGPDSPEFPGRVTVVYAPATLVDQAEELAAMFWPSEVRVADRTHGSSGGLKVFVTSSFRGSLILPQKTEAPRQTLLKGQEHDKAAWQALSAKTPLKLEMPSTWSPGFSYSEFHRYSITDTNGKKSAAAVVVGKTPQGGSWSIQTMRWLEPPAIQNPNSVRDIAGTKYMLFYEGDHLQMVAWRRNKALYWVRNTLDNQISNDVMLGLSTSFTPVQ